MEIVGSSVFDESNIGESKRKALADDIWNAGHEVIKKHPDVSLIITMACTPKPADWPEGTPHDSSHTAFISGEKEVSIEDLEKYLQMVLAQMVNLYRRVARRDPELVDIMSKEK